MKKSSVILSVVISLCFLTIKAGVSSYSGRSKTYDPLDSELFLNALPLDTFNIYKSSDDPTPLIGIYRLSGQHGPFTASNIAVRTDTITNDFISIYVTDKLEPLNDFPGFEQADESVSRLQLAVLRDKNGAATTGVAAYTVKPNGIPSTQTVFYKLPKLPKLRDDYEYNEAYSRSLVDEIMSTPIPEDSLQRRLLDRAYAIGALDSLKSDFDTTAMPRDIPAPKTLPAKKIIKMPAAVDFFNIPKGNAGKQLLEAIGEIPYSLMSCDISSKDMSLTIRMHLDGIVSLELAEDLKPYFKSELHYLWNGKRYQLIKQ